MSTLDGVLRDGMAFSRKAKIFCCAVGDTTVCYKLRPLPESQPLVPSQLSSSVSAAAAESYCPKNTAGQTCLPPVQSTRLDC